MRGLTFLILFIFPWQGIAADKKLDIFKGDLIEAVKMLDARTLSGFFAKRASVGSCDSEYNTVNSDQAADFLVRRMGAYRSQIQGLDVIEAPTDMGPVLFMRPFKSANDIFRIETTRTVDEKWVVTSVSKCVVEKAKEILSFQKAFGPSHDRLH